MVRCFDLTAVVGTEGCSGYVDAGGAANSGRLSACFPLDRAVRRRKTMRLIAAFTVVTICVLLGSAAIAEQRQALCKLVVDGKTYINGLCDFEVIDPDGSFSITGVVRHGFETPGCACSGGQG